MSPNGPTEALLALAPNVLPTAREASRRHLDALAVLSRTVPPYRLQVGADLGGAVQLLRGLAGRLP